MIFSYFEVEIGCAKYLIAPCLLSHEDMEVYHPVLKIIVVITVQVYVFLADQPDKFSLLDILEYASD